MKPIVIVGGGLAGLTAAVRLTAAGQPVHLYETRRQLGGRAGSFLDADSSDWIDHCQHVGMGCCQRLLALCRDVGEPQFFRRDDTLHFVAPDGRVLPFRAAPWLPAPLHLAPALARWSHLSWRDRWRLARTLHRLTRLRPDPSLDEQPAGPWLRKQGESAQSLDYFWSVVLVSALSETLDHLSLAAARQVFVDGFFRSRDAYHLLVPARPLHQLSESLGRWLTARGAQVSCQTTVESVEGDARGIRGLVLRDAAGSTARIACEQVIVAVPWHRVRTLLSPPLIAALPELDRITAFPPSAITSLHFWWESRWTELNHAVLVDRIGQWLFCPPAAVSGEGERHFYTQVVISAAHRGATLSPEALSTAVADELRAIWPAARETPLVRWRFLRQPQACFAPLPGLAQWRPDQRTAVPGLFWAGDWTRTGWPATMEGAIRSGEQAARACLSSGATSDA